MSRSSAVGQKLVLPAREHARKKERVCGCCKALPSPPVRLLPFLTPFTTLPFFTPVSFGRKAIYATDLAMKRSHLLQRYCGFRSTILSI